MVAKKRPCGYTQGRTSVAKKYRNKPKNFLPSEFSEASWW
jgi:hypothetical protein